MNRTVLSPRQENLLAAAMAMLAAAAQPAPSGGWREKGHVFDDHVAGWFNRTLKGTRTPEPATHQELEELRALLNRTGLVALETA